MEMLPQEHDTTERKSCQEMLSCSETENDKFGKKTGQYSPISHQMRIAFPDLKGYNETATGRKVFDVSQAVTFKCPSCGAYLEYDPNAQQFTCPYCGQSLTHEQMQMLSGNQTQKTETRPVPPVTAHGAGGHLRSYHCNACGAEIVTEETTAATRCYYCHSPVVLTDRLDGEFKPYGVVPFSLDKDAALRKFKEFIASKKFVDKRFFSDDQMDNFSGVYYPYWLGNINGEGTFDGEGTRVSVVRGHRETVTTTKFFHVTREGKLQFRNLVRKALKKQDRQITDGIHPYQMEGMKKFDMAYLSGFLAEKRDIDESEVSEDILNEVSQRASARMKENSKFQTLRGKTSFKPTKKEMLYVLLPAWVLTYRSDKADEVYYYMMNAQTGKVCGRLPVDKAKLMRFAAGICAAVTAVLCMGGMFIW